MFQLRKVGDTPRDRSGSGPLEEPESELVAALKRRQKQREEEEAVASSG
jgi:hypothetical protein